MKKNIITSILLILCGVSLFASQTTSVILSSGGKFMVDKYVKFYSYSTVSNQVSLFDSCLGTYTNIAFSDNGNLFLSTGNKVLRYSTSNINMPIREDSLEIKGINSGLSFKNLLVFGAGFGAGGAYLNIYSDFSKAKFYTDLSITGFVNSMAKRNDTLFVLHQQNSSDSIYLSVFTEKKQDSLQLLNQFLLGVFQYGLPKLIAHNNGYLYAQSSPYATKPYLVSVDYPKQSMDTIRFMSVSGLINTNENNIYLNLNGSLQEYNPKTGATKSIVSVNYSNGAYDSINKEYYLITSDFVNPDKVFRVSNAGSIIDSFNVGSSTEALTVLYQNRSAVNETFTAQNKSFLYPNPANETIRIQTQDNLVDSKIEIYDMQGRLQVSQTLNGQTEMYGLNKLLNGVYTVRLFNNGKMYQQKLMVQHP